MSVSTLVKMEKEVAKIKPKSFSMSTEFRDRIQVCKEVGLENQIPILNNEFRNQHIAEQGFCEMTPLEAVKQMFPKHEWGNKWDSIHYENEKLEWHSQIGEEKDAYVKTFLTTAIKNVGNETERLQMVCATLRSFQRSVPYGVLLRVKELQDLKTFDFFTVVAPRNMFKLKEDPILLGCLGRYRNQSNDSIIYEANQTFFVARWDYAEDE